MHILVVDDDEDLRSTLAEMLEDEGFRVTQAASGREALRRLEHESADLIMLDYMMPEMSGPEFREVQRARADVSGIPVVVLTAAGLTSELAKMDPDAIVRKPFEVSELLRCIHDVARRHEQRGVTPSRSPAARP